MEQPGSSRDYYGDMTGAYPLNRRLAGLLALLALLLSGAIPAATASADDDAPPVGIGLALESGTFAAGDTLSGTLTLQHGPGFATWPAQEDLIPADFLSTPLAVEIVDASVGWATLAEIAYPEPQPLSTTDSFTGDTVEVLGYAETIEIPLSITLTGEPTGTLTLAVTFQAFTAESEGSFETIVVTAPLGETGGGLLADQPSVQFFGFEIERPSGIVGAGFLFLFAAVGGFILNLTPCVLPVIPLKVMTLTNHAGESKSRALVLGLWMALGVVAFWTVLGLPLAVLVAVGRDFVDPSALIFGTWWVAIGVGAVVGLMGLGIMGLFMINLPQSAYGFTPTADNAGGSFLFGVMTAVLGLPCFGFVVAPLLAGAATMPPAQIASVFVGLGVGMAAPYLVFSVKPGLLAFMPKAGPASELIKQVMGLLLIAGALFFVSAGVKGLFSTYPYLSGQLTVWLIVLTLVGTGLWLVYQTLKITKSGARRLIFGGLGLLIAGAPIAFAVSSGQGAYKEFQRIEAGKAFAQENGFTLTSWNAYDHELFEKARASGLVVILDFTADWCINCKVLENTVLKPDPVGSLMWGETTVPVKADITTRSGPSQEKLEELGFTGIPQLVIYGPGLEEPWVSSAYTPAQVVAAIEAAGG